MDLIEIESLPTQPGQVVHSGAGTFVPHARATDQQAQFQDGRSGKPIKRRAPQACEGCRARKIRCDVARHGVPCMPCRMDGANCVVVESRRKRRKPDVGATALVSANHFQPDKEPERPVDIATASTHDVAMNLNHQVPESIDSSVFWQETMNEPIVSATPLDHLLSQSQLPAGDETPTPQLLDALPPYIKVLPIHFEQDDITYLRNKGALAIPPMALRNELLQSYADYVHPFMPLVDLGDLFLAVRDSNSRLEPISLLLFQAVMFAGVAHVALDVLKQNGHASRREARRAFFNKARLLYDLDYEDDPMATVQALLLMTYWREDPAGRKETHHWIEIALSLAQKLGLQHSTDESTPMKPSLDKLRRRIWWATYVRDCQISASTGSATRISEIDFNMPMLQPADFEIGNLPGGAHSSVPGTYSQSSERRMDLANMFIDMVKVSLCTSYILSLQNGVAGSRGSKHTATVISAIFDPEINEHTPEEVLTAWKVSLTEVSRYVVPTRQMVDSGGSHVVVHRAFLHMTYNSLLFALHHFLLQQKASSNPANMGSGSQAAVRIAATNISTIASALYDLDLIRYLPSPTITVLLPAIVSHLSDALAPASSLRHESLERFHRCMQCMAALRDMYAAADYSTAFLQDAIMRAPIGPQAAHTSIAQENRSITTAPVPEPVSPGHLHRRASVREPNTIDLVPSNVRQSISQTSPLSTATADDWQLNSSMMEYGYLRPTPMPFTGDESLFATSHESDNQQMFSPGWFLNAGTN